MGHIFSIRHCQAYECLMNGSNKLEEADRKPFAFCAVCTRKLASYFGFNGEELDLYIKLKDIFKLLNYKDDLENFVREIDLYERIIDQLVPLYKFGGNFDEVVNENEIKISIV